MIFKVSAHPLAKRLKHPRILSVPRATAPRSQRSQGWRGSLEPGDQAAHRNPHLGRKGLFKSTVGNYSSFQKELAPPRRARTLLPPVLGAPARACPVCCGRDRAGAVAGDQTRAERAAPGAVRGGVQTGAASGAQRRGSRQTRNAATERNSAPPTPRPPTQAPRSGENFRGISLSQLDNHPPKCVGIAKKRDGLQKVESEKNESGQDGAGTGRSSIIGGCIKGESGHELQRQINETLIRGRAAERRGCWRLSSTHALILL